LEDIANDGEAEPAVTPVEPVQKSILKPKPTDEKVEAHVNWLRRWKACFTHFGNKVSTPLKVKVDNAIAGDLTDLTKITQLENDLISSAGVDIFSPPSQADMILNTVNPLVENAAIYAGFDVAGFSQVAATTCKDPLIVSLIHYDLLSGVKPPPIAILAFAYINTLCAVNSHNMAKKQLRSPSSNWISPYQTLTYHLPHPSHHHPLQLHVTRTHTTSAATS